MKNVRSLRPREDSVSLRCAAALGFRLAKDADRLGFSELAERARQKARAFDAEAVRAAFFEQAAEERDELRTGAELILARAARSDGSKETA
jgi:hypothetical protein